MASANSAFASGVLNLTCNVVHCIVVCPYRFSSTLFLLAARQITGGYTDYQILTSGPARRPPLAVDAQTSLRVLDDNDNMAGSVLLDSGDRVAAVFRRGNEHRAAPPRGGGRGRGR